MIDFKQKRSMGRYGCEGLEEWNALNGYAAKIREDLEASKTNFFWLGVHLIDLYSSNLYRLTFDREKLGVSGLVDNCSAECFFAYCYDEFGLDKTQVSRYMNIVDEFGDGLRGFKKEWEPYSYSQLCELLPLSSEQRKPIQPDWTIKRIREYKKSLGCDVATERRGNAGSGRTAAGRKVYPFREMDEAGTVRQDNRFGSGAGNAVAGNRELAQPCRRKRPV